ncbi:type II secretion system F family protein [Alienimonas chondri]|uniref:General secretion pathway protein F n=1 Tax=Alienimonas chondri TaxID=2681879 RepID=A0ABX1VC95_9PLAN|nr:type II secretion system F family protein [Alienimonas chondri]NNJ25720.1 Type II secretion system protein F [Alienimonas chondri]
MPDFAYTARDASGASLTGTITAAAERDALTTLAGRGLFPLSVELNDAAKSKAKAGVKRVGGKHLSAFYSQLSDLLKSGVPLLRSLELLERKSAAPALQAVLEDVRAEVAEGNRLADAMRRHPKAFSELAVSMVTAGEEGGFLEDVLKRIAAFTEHQQELRGKVLGALVYPVFLLVMGSAIVIGMVTFFVPNFAPIFERMASTGDLPAATSFLMAASDVLRSQWALVIVAAVIAGGYLLVRYVRDTEEGRLRFDQVRLFGWKVGKKEIGFGPIARNLAIARFCRILGTLLHNGVPILQSLRIAKDATGNRVLSAAIETAAESITAGRSIAGPLASSGQFPEEVTEMIAVGEEANNLEQVLIDIADATERHTARQLDLFVRLLEPIMLTVMAGAILFLCIALMLPILKSSGIA